MMLIFQIILTINLFRNPMTTVQNETYNAAKAIDDLLELDDGALLASLSRYKTSIIELFGREGMVNLICQVIEQANYIDFFSKRSKREIDPGHPEINLRVNHLEAIKNEESFKKYSRYLNQNEKLDQKLLTEIKTAVIYNQICYPLATEMSKALAPHWKKSKKFINDNYDMTNFKELSLIIYTLFSIRVNQDIKTPSEDRMCSLTLFF
jgi:hypothetical protein